jgi:hypothetical protein
MKLGISLLALCGAAYALSVPGTFPPANVAKIVNAQVYMGRNQTIIVSLPMRNRITPSLTRQETKKRSLGTMYADKFIADQLQH